MTFENTIKKHVRSNQSGTTLERLAAAARSIAFGLNGPPIVIDEDTCTIIEPDVAKLLLSSKNCKVRSTCCKILAEYPDIVRVPTELREKVAKKILEYRLNR